MQSLKLNLSILMYSITLLTQKEGNHEQAFTTFTRCCNNP